MATNDWLGLMQRTKQAYKPTFGQTVLQPMGQAFSQGMVGKQIAQEELKKAIFTALLGKNTPMVGEEPATMEQMMGAMRGKPGVIPSLFGAKEPPELTWKPIETTTPSTYKEKLLKNFIDTGEIPTSFKGKEKQFHKVIGTYVPPEKPVEEELPVDWKIWQQAVKEATDPMTKEVDIDFARKRYLELSKVFIPGRKPLPAPVEKPIEEYSTEELLRMQKGLLGK